MFTIKRNQCSRSTGTRTHSVAFRVIEVQSADFKDDGGHLVAEVVLTSNVPWSDVANASKQIQAPPASR